ncbi:MAG: hypothetical protein ACLP4V_17085 [Methylocella sp.]
MQGLVNFTGELGYIIAVLLPTFCYIASLACFLFAGWGFWMQARPDNPFRGKPWIPAVSLILSGAFASFDKILNMANASAGTAVQVSIGALTSYTPPNAANFTQGNTPGDTVVNVVTLFQGFFQSFGALACFFAIVAWRSVVNGQSNRSQGGCLVQFVFGVMLINILTVTQWLVSMFQVTA